ncbi:MAG: hypothetical protein ACTSPB_07150 [Candidatus Thorarchaeota archaeon]
MRVLLLLLSLLLLVINDGITIADNTREVTSNETSNPSASATITITMYAVADE